MHQRSQVLQLTEQLVEIDSTTPNDNGCQLVIANRLKAIGFEIRHLKFGDVDVYKQFPLKSKLMLLYYLKFLYFFEINI